jgi:hypothetical protein
MPIKIDGTNGVLQAYDYQTLTTGFSYTFAAGTQVLIINPADALATGTITMPALPVDGMTITISTSKTINTLTINANTGQSIVGGGAQSLGNNQDITYIYRLTDTTWYSYSGSLPLAKTVDVNGTRTTGTVTSGTAALTVASATGINEGDYITGEGIAPGTYVTALSGTGVTMSANANATLSADPVTFYSTGKAVTPASIGGQLCRAWVNFNGAGTVTILAAYNVTSITDNGTGLYTANFTTAMPDVNYSAVLGVGSDVAGNNRAFYGITTKTVSAYPMSLSSNGVAFDGVDLSLVIFR